MCLNYAPQRRRPLGSWTGPAASGAEKQSGTHEASGKCSSWGAPTSLIGWQPGAHCKQPVYLSSTATGRIPAHLSQLRPAQLLYFILFFLGQNLKAVRRWKAATMQKSHKNWGRAKELQLRKRICLQSFLAQDWVHFPHSAGE